MDNSQRYTTVPGSFSKLLDKIPTLGRPDKVNSGWLASIGMGGGNNQSMLRVLKGLGAVASDGTPSELWGALRAQDKPKIAAAVRTMYSDLFAIYPDANKKDDEALIAFFRANTDLGEKAQRLSVQTFKVLCDAGDFSVTATADAAEANTAASSPAPAGAAKTKQTTPDPPAAKDEPRSAAGQVALTVNIELHLPASSDGEVYDKLFGAMAKHLGGLVAR
jgi:hypothetical protein